MNRSTQTRLHHLPLGLSEAERVLQRELAQAPGAAAPRPWLRRVARLFTAVFVAQTLLAGAPAMAQVTATPGAPAGQKPLIDAAANGTPIVLIAPPGKAGVSRNQFEQFNVGPKGLILNNSTGNVQTQIGGWITGNLQLGLTPARIILNEVTGPNASQLKGTIEVGGQRADIVIANPNGITCDGCGFLNTDRATLATGAPQFGADGVITGLDVRQGVIRIGPDGLNASEQQQLDLYARGLVIEGEVYTQNLQAVIGANQVLYGTLNALPQATTQDGIGEAPRFAVDIKALGGMYAGQIYLIATDKGLGVNSEGRAATLAGNLLLAANGDLTLKDTYATGNAQLISGGNTTLTGQTLANGSITLDAPQQLTNSGALQAPTLQLNTPAIHNSGSMAQTAPGQNLVLNLPGGLYNSGQIYTPADLSIQAATVDSGAGGASGQLMAGGSLQVAASSLVLAGQQLAANGSITVQAQTLAATGGGMNAGGNVSLDASGKLDITGTAIAANGQARLSGSEVALDHARIAALGNVQITSTGAIAANAADLSSNAVLSLQGSRVDVRSATLTALVTASIKADGDIRLDASQLAAGQRIELQSQGISTAGATVAADKITIDAGTGLLNNQGGKVRASSADADALTVSATGISNLSGELRTNGGLTLDARGGLLDNTAGVVSGTTGTLANLGGLTNKGGTVYTQSDLAITATALDNSQGSIVTAGSLTVRTPGLAINNTAGLLQAGAAVVLDSGSADLQNAGGTVTAGTDLTIRAATVDTAAGTLAAGKSLDVAANNLLAAGAKLGSGSAMNLSALAQADLRGANLGAGADITVQANTVQAAGANVAANGDLQVAGNSITGGSWSAQGKLTAVSQGALNLSGGALLAGGEVLAQGQGINTDNARVSGHTVTLDAGNAAFSNVGGQIIAAASSGTALNIAAMGINNTGGTLASAGDANLNAGGQAIDNTGGSIVVTGNLQMQASQLANRNGTLSSTSALDLQGFALDNNGGTIKTQGDLTINTAGQALDNTAGKLVADGQVTLQAGTLGSANGTIAAGANLGITATGALDAHNATLAGEAGVTVFAGGAVDLSGASITAVNALTVQAGEALNADAATLKGNDQLALSGASIAAADAVVSALGHVTLNAGAGDFMAPRALVQSQSGGISLNAANVNVAGAVPVGGATTDYMPTTGLLAGQAIQINAAGAVDVSHAATSAGTDISIGAQGSIANTAGQIIAGGHASLAGSSLDNRGGIIDANGPVALSVTGGQVVNDQGRISTRDVLTMGTSSGLGAGPLSRLSNAGGVIETTGALNAQLQDFNNQGGSVTALAGLSLSGGPVNNAGGLLAANGNVSVNTQGGAFNSDNGKVFSTQGDIALTTGELQASGAQIVGQGRVDVAATGAMAAQGAAFAAGGNLGVTATQGIDVQGGSVSGQVITLDAGSGALNNTAGQILATAGADLRSTGLANAGGTIAANGNLTINAAQAHANAVTDSTGGRLQSGQALSLTAGATTLANATVTSGASMTLATGALQAGQARISAQNDLSVTANGAVTAAQAVIEAGGAATLNATQGIDVSGGGLSANTISLDAGTGMLNNNAGSILAVSGADIRSTGLGNVGGTIATNGKLAINAAQARANAATDSTGGILQSGQSLSLTAGATTLANATVTSGGDLTLNTGALQASGAALAAGGNATLTAVLTAAQGMDISHASVSAQNIYLDAGTGALNNTGGSLLALGAAELRATGLNNVDGVIAANGALAINAAQAGTATQADNTRGTIRSAQASVTLTTGDLINSRANSTDAGSVLNAATDLTVHAAGAVDNARSEISGGNDVHIAATGALNTSQARIVAGRDASVSASAIDNTAGLIASNRDTMVTATGGGVANTSGAIQASHDLAIAATGAVANNNGQLATGNQLALAGGALTNTQGQISAQTGSVTLLVTSYTNSAGSVVAGAGLSLDTQGGALSANGATLASGAGMTLRAGAAQLNDASVTAGGSIDAQVTSLQAARAVVQAAGSLGANAGTGEFNADASNWLAGQGVALGGGAVVLTGAVVSANTAVAVTGASIDATRASITSPGDVSVVAHGGALNIGQASLLAGQDLTATGTGAGSTAGAQALAGRDLTLGNGASFDFAAADLQYQFGRDLTVRAQGISTAGQQVAARNLTLDAGNGQLDNQGGTLQATGNLSASGTGLNNQGGVIAAQGSVNASAGGATLNNAGGQIYSTQGAATAGGAVIDNATGILSAATDLTLTGGSLNNAGNTIAAGRNLTTQLSGALNNAGGALVANTGAASISAGDLDNQSGVISGSTAATLTTRAINNDAGVIESGSGGISINTQGSALTNTHSGSTRGIVSQGAISIAAGDLNNQGGYIGANAGLNITQASGINNQGGTLLGLGSSSVTTSGTLNNQGGSILSTADLGVSASALNNSPVAPGQAAGTVYAARDLTVSAATLDNSGTKNASYTTGLLAGRNATITAGTLNNTGGAIVALGDATVRATGSLNNTQGQISGSTVTIDTPQLTNTAGRADAQNRLSLKAAQFSADGTLASNGDLEMTLQGDQVYSGTYSANGSLSVSTTGSITNQGHISALNRLTLAAAGITNEANATIDSVATTLQTAGTVNNLGLINSTNGQTTINAGTLNNTGRIYGDSIVITTTGSTNNSMNAQGASAVIATRSSDLTVNGTLNNTDGGLVLSLGNLQINGAARNDGSTLYAQRNLGIQGALSNTNAGLTTGTETRTESAGGFYITPSNSTTRYDASTLGWNGDSGGHYVLPSTRYPLGAFGATPKPAAVQCGLDGIGGEGGSWVCNYAYGTSDPIWALMGVASPGAGPGAVPPQCMDFGGETGNAQRITTGACGGYWASYDAYAQAQASTYGQLDVAINNFNADLNSRTLIDWYETTITGKTITETTVASSKAAQVLAGGSITLSGGGDNINSVIVAGGAINAPAGGNNIATPGTRQTTTSGTMVFSHRVYHGGFSDSYSRDVSAPQPIADGAVTESFNLPILRFQTGGSPVAPGSAGTSSLTGAAAASVASVGNINSAARNASTATGSVTDGATGAGTGGTVQVATTSTAQAQGAQGVADTHTASGATVTGGASGGSTVTGTNPATQDIDTTATSGPPTASLGAAPQAALPGSVIATGVRAGQLAAITASLGSFAEAARTLPLQAAAVDTSARLASPPVVKAAGYTTVRASGTVQAPNNQLFRLNRGPKGPLVETDPAFTGYRTFISSAYMLKQLAMDPERTLKLYGDGFAEQRLVDDQILALTGRRYLSGYQSTEDEYQDLLNAGVLYAQKYQLTPGVALSAAQMALLTTDIVWLEPQNVTLPDGSTVQALVPAVYLRRPIAGDLTPAGALIAGSSVTLRTQGDPSTGSGQDITNTGTIIANGDAAAGEGRLTVSAQNLTNSGTLAGNQISLSAINTLNNTGGVVQGLGTGSSATLNARDIILRTTTQTSSASIQGPNGESTGTRTNVDRIATVSADSVTLAALGNIQLAGASINATGNLAMTAGGAINSEAVQTGYTLNIPMGGSNSGRSSYYDLSATTQQLSTLEGSNVVIKATGDANFKGTNVTAANDLSVTAKNITIEAAKDSLAIDQQGVNRNGYERVAKADETLTGGSFTAGNNVSLNATAGNITATGAIIAADKGTAALVATGAVNILNATTEHSQVAESYDSNARLLGTHTKTANNASEITRVEGSSISGNTVLIQAGEVGADGKPMSGSGNVTIQASQINAKGAVTVLAGNDIKVITAQQLADTTNQNSESNTASGLAKAIGIGAVLMAGPLGGAVAGTSQSQGQAVHQSSSAAVGSLITGGTVNIEGGRDVQLQATTVIADNNVSISAGRNLIVENGEDARASDASSTYKKSGFIGSLLQPAVGVIKQSEANQDTSTTQVQSTIASLGGNVTLKAGEHYTQTASNVIALQGDANIAAKAITINEAQDTATGAQQTQSSRVAIGASVSVPLLDAARAIGQIAEAASDTSNGRVQALAAAAAALNAKTVIDSAAQLAAGNAGGIKISLSLGSSKSESQSNTESSTVAGSGVTAKNVSLTATGDGANSNIVVTGSNITATNNAALKADGKVILQAGTNTEEQHSTNSNSGWNVGVGFAMGGGQNGFTLDASASKGKGNADGSDTSYTNSHVSAGNTVSIESGGDTVLRGAVVSGTTVNADVGGKLIVQSLQDTSTYDSKQTSSGIGVSLCIPPFCYGMSTVAGGSVSAGKTNINGTYQSVTEQSALKAGDGGFNVNVKGDTVLVGGAISSTDKAVSEGKNTFTPGGAVIATDLYNTADFDAKGYSVTVGAGNQLGASRAGIGLMDGTAASVTTAGISGVEGDTGVRSADAPTGIAKILNPEQVSKDIAAQITITAEFGKQGTQAWGQYANTKFTDAVLAEDNAGAECWGPSGACRASGHAMLGMLTAGAGGAVGAATSSVMAPAVIDFLTTTGLPKPVAQALTQLGAGTVGAATGGAAGAIGALNESGNNAVLAIPLIVEGIIEGGVAAATACARIPKCVEIVGGSLLIALMPAPPPGPNHTGNPDGAANPGGGSTITLNPGPGGITSTTTPGTVVTNTGTPGSGTGQAVTGVSTTVTPAGTGSIGGTLVFNAPGHPEPDPARDPTVGGYQGSTQTSIDRINNVLAGSTDTTRGSGVRNATQPSGVSVQLDFEYLSQGTSRPIETPSGPGRLALLPDGTKVIYRPGSSASSGNMPTIEVQRPDGSKVIEIRYGP